MIKLVIDISEEDIKDVMNTYMTVGNMYDTTKGRIYCAITHAYYEREDKLNGKDNMS